MGKQLSVKKEIHEEGLSATQVIMLGFLLAVAVGTLLLSIPFATASGEGAPFMTALFTATTSVCVTGLTLVDTFSYWSIFGQVIILLLIQLGGLGVIAFSTSIMLIIGKRVTLRNRLLLESAFNLNTLSGLVQFLLRMLKGTFIVEGIGFLCYLPVFVRKGDVIGGIWKSLFLSISAFCNAGIDLIGADSLVPYEGNVWVNIVTMALIILGGLGFIVWWDIVRVIRLARRERLPLRQMLHRLNLHSKIVLATTGILIAGGAVLVFALEYSNPATLGALPFGRKVMAAVFQSVTLRTAGFATISQSGLRDSTVLLSLILMFTGGSTSGTAGGVKTSSVALILLAAIATAKGSERVTAFRRTIPLRILRKALGVVVISFICVITATVALSVVTGGDFVDVIYETFSAIGTVGLTRDFTRTMNLGGQIIIVICMYLGRVGPISLASAFNFRHKSGGELEYPEREILVG